LTCARIPTAHGEFSLCLYANNLDDKDHLALVMGEVEGLEGVLVRIHSECFTGDVLGSLRCDCRSQLDQALRMIAGEQRGVVIYLRQEGRGIGLRDKLRAYNLQDQGYDTVEANLALGFRDDERDYAVAAHMLESLKVKSIRLMTNNPRKINDLMTHGVKVTERISLIIPPNPYNRFYLETKAVKSGHLIDFNGKEHLLEQIDRPIVEGMTPDQIAGLDSLHDDGNGAQL